MGDFFVVFLGGGGSLSFSPPLRNISAGTHSLALIFQSTISITHACASYFLNENLFTSYFFCFLIDSALDHPGQAPAQCFTIIMSHLANNGLFSYISVGISEFGIFRICVREFGPIWAFSRAEFGSEGTGICPSPPLPK